MFYKGLKLDTDPNWKSSWIRIRFVKAAGSGSVLIKRTAGSGSVNNEWRPTALEYLMTGLGAAASEQCASVGPAQAVWRRRGQHHRHQLSQVLQQSVMHSLLMPVVAVFWPGFFGSGSAWILMMGKLRQGKSAEIETVPVPKGRDFVVVFYSRDFCNICILNADMDTVRSTS